MTQQTINVGAVANDQSGDTLRVAFSKANANFTDLYTQLGTVNSSYVTSNSLSTTLNNYVTSTGLASSLAPYALISNLNGVQYTTLNIISVSFNSTYNLSTTTSTNILKVMTSNLTATINMPASPTDGQITSFSTINQSMTLAVGTGTVIPSFAGATPVGTTFKYAYNSGDTTWYRIA